MTSVFSGGIAYEFYDSPDIQSAHWGYGLVRVERAIVGGGLTKLPDFHGLRARLEACDAGIPNSVLQDDSETKEMHTVSQKVRDIPPLSNHWKAGHALPYSLADWSGVRRGLDEKMWVEVQVEEIENVEMSLQPRIIST